jgi:hypothetical protein
MFHQIVAHDLFSVLDEQDLESSSKEIYKILQPDGTFVHFCTRLPFINALLDRYDEDEWTLIPTMNRHDQFVGFNIISRQELKDKINKIQKPLQKKVLEIYLEFSANQRHHFYFLSKTLTGNRCHQTRDLTTWIKDLKCPSMKEISLRDDFQDRMRKALEHAGFTIIKDELRTASIIDKSTTHRQNSFNCFYLKNGAFWSRECYVLAPGMVQENVETHVVVARKPAEI